jgi:hypothetical protein
MALQRLNGPQEAPIQFQRRRATVPWCAGSTSRARPGTTYTSTYTAGPLTRPRRHARRPSAATPADDGRLAAGPPRQNFEPKEVGEHQSWGTGTALRNVFGTQTYGLLFEGVSFAPSPHSALETFYSRPVGLVLLRLRPGPHARAYNFMHDLTCLGEQEERLNRFPVLHRLRLLAGGSFQAGHVYRLPVLSV